MPENPYASPVEEIVQPDKCPVRWGCFFIFGLSSSVIGFLIVAVATPRPHVLMMRRLIGERLTLTVQSIGLLAVAVGPITLAVVAVARAIATEIEARRKAKK